MRPGGKQLSRETWAEQRTPSLGRRDGVPSRPSPLAREGPVDRVILKNAASLLLIQGANFLLPLLTFPYLVRVLGPANFGILVRRGGLWRFLADSAHEHRPGRCTPTGAPPDAAAGRSHLRRWWHPVAGRTLSRPPADGPCFEQSIDVIRWMAFVPLIVGLSNVLSSSSCFRWA